MIDDLIKNNSTNPVIIDTSIDDDLPNVIPIADGDGNTSDKAPYKDFEKNTGIRYIEDPNPNQTQLREELEIAENEERQNIKTFGLGILPVALVSYFLFF